MRVLVPLAAIASITILESLALLEHIDGAMLSVSIAAVAALGGYTLREVVKKDDDEK